MIQNNPVMTKVRIHPKNNWLNNCGYTQEEEDKIYDELLDAVQQNPRWFLDNADKLPAYRLSWVCYTQSKVSLPRKFITETPRRSKKKPL